MYLDPWLMQQLHAERVQQAAEERRYRALRPAKRPFAGVRARLSDATRTLARVLPDSRPEAARPRLSR